MALIHILAQNRPPSGRPVTGGNFPASGKPQTWPSRPAAGTNGSWPAVMVSELAMGFKHSTQVTLKIAVFYTKTAGKPAHVAKYVDKAKRIFSSYNVILDVLEPPNNVLDYVGAVLIESDVNKVRGLAEQVLTGVQGGSSRLPVIVCPPVSVQPDKPVASMGDYGTTRISPSGGSVVIDGTTWKPFTMINSLIESRDDATLAHEIGHAAGLFHDPPFIRSRYRDVDRYLQTKGIDVNKNLMLEFASATVDRTEMFAFQAQKLATPYFKA